jgi:hypothetical protein
MRFTISFGARSWRSSPLHGAFCKYIGAIR